MPGTSRDSSPGRCCKRASSGRADSLLHDVGSPYAYLAAERVDREMPCGVEWHPVLLGAVFKATGRCSWAQTERRDAGIAEIERRAAARGLAPLRWPDPWPNDGLRAMRAAVYAHQRGVGRRFALEAFRIQFRDGWPLSHPDAVASAAERAGLDPDEALRATDDPDVKQQLRERTAEALQIGVYGVPTIIVDDAVFWGDDRIEEAARRCCIAASPSAVSARHDPSTPE